MPSRRTVSRSVALVALLGGLAGAPAQAAELEAGAAVADITPPSGGTTLGFVRPDITVKGAHGRLTGRALVLDDGDTKVALLATDLAFALDKESLVARLKDLGYTHDTILYTGTHTHSGPEQLASWQVAQLAKAIREADARRVPARAAWATGKVRDANRQRSVEAHLANHQQDLFYGEGKVEDDPAGADHARDLRLRLLRVESVRGAPIAAWTQFPVHPTTSTPAADEWDADLAGAANVQLERDIAKPGFVALWSNGSAGDLMPAFDDVNPTATMERNGLRIAKESGRLWRVAGRGLARTLPVDVRWTRVCYCGQEVEAGKRIGTTPIFGLPFLGGSEDGASIFHEPLATEGKRTPAAAADPVQGRKIQAVPSAPLEVHETNPEVQVLRIGNRLLLAAPGEPSVEMGRRFEAAVEAVRPAGIAETLVVGLANDYLGYLTTPEEYEQQHYEGGHTVFGTFTSLLTRSSFVTLTRALRDGAPAPAPSVPGGLGATDQQKPTVGNGGVKGTLTEQPKGTVERMSVLDVGWTGAPGGVDRPLDKPFLSLERKTASGFQQADSDLGRAFSWREAEGKYRARYDVAPHVPLGVYRVRVTSGAYDLIGAPFTLERTDDLRLLGVRRRALKGKRARTRLTVVAQQPTPDPKRSILHREASPEGGRVIIRVRGRRYVAKWNAAELGWSVTIKRKIAEGTAVKVSPRGLRDGSGNVNREGAVLRAGTFRVATWPPNMGVGGGRTPGVGGEGTFPP